MNHQPMEVDSTPVVTTSTTSTTSLSSVPSPTVAPASPVLVATSASPSVHAASNFTQQAVLAHAIHVPAGNLSLSRPVMASTAATIAHASYGSNIQPTTATAVAATPAILTLPTNVSPNATASIPHGVALRANIAHGHPPTTASTATNATQSTLHTTNASILSNAIPAVPMAARSVTTAKAIPAVNVNSGIPWKQGSPAFGAVTPPNQLLNAIPAASISATSASTSPHPMQISRSSTPVSNTWQSTSSVSSSSSNTLQTPQLRKPMSRSPSPKFMKGMTKSSSTSSLDSLANLAAMASKAPAYSPTQPPSSSNTTGYQPKFSVTIPTSFNSLPNPAISPLSALAHVVSQDSGLGSFDSRFEFRTIASASSSNNANSEHFSFFHSNSALSSSSSSSGVPVVNTVTSDHPPILKPRSLSSTSIKTTTRMRSPSNPLPASELFHNLRHRTRRQYQRIGIENQTRLV